MTARVVGRRICAVLAVTSAALHGIMISSATNIAVVALTVTMLAVCLYCAYGLWFRGTLRDWTLIALMNLAMIAVHLPMSAGHHHGRSGDVSAAQHSVVMTLATTVAAVEVAVAAAVLFYMTRARARVLVQ